MNYKVCTKIKRKFAVVQWLSCVWLLATPWTTYSTAVFCPSLSPRVCSNSYPLSWWWYLNITCPAVLYFFYLRTFPASGSFPMSWLFTSGDQNIGTTASPSVSSNEYLGLISFRTLISLQSIELSRVISSTKIWSINSLVLRSDQISCSVVSDSLRPHESQHTRAPRPSPTPGVHPDSRPSSLWCHPAICLPLLLLPPIPLSIRVFSNGQLFAWVAKVLEFQL